MPALLAVLGRRRHRGGNSANLVRLQERSRASVRALTVELRWTIGV